MEIHLPTFLCHALDGGEWLALGPDCFSPGGRAPVPIGRRLGGLANRSGRCAVETSLLPMQGTELRFLGCPAYRLVANCLELKWPVHFKLVHD